MGAEWGAQGFAFIYNTKNVKGKKLLPKSEAAHFIGLEGDQRLILVYVPKTQTIRRMRRADFHFNKNSPLPSVSVLLDGIYRERIIEEELNEDFENNENLLQTSLASLQINKTISSRSKITLTPRLVPHKTFLGTSDGPALPK